ncbi:MAG TPA: peptide MFS transporter [Pseudomonadota bacterium]|nr:peptide MFS transporter [Pseudomonadota bacterium]
MASRHPKGLYVLFFTEMWERFGFYLMLALFTLYLNEKLGWTEEESLGAYGWYMFFVYLTPFVGGIFADRVFGYRRAVLTGASLLGVGYALLGSPSMTVFYASLTLLVIGNGLFKPNISTLVGNLYPQGDSRRDAAFSIFYMGINIGAGLAGPVGGYVRNHFGWMAAFATAGVGMALSFVIFALFRHHLEIADQRSSVSALLDVPLGPDYEDRPDPPAVEKQRIVALAIICAIVMTFWMAFHQNGSTLTLWARDNTIREYSLLGHTGSISTEAFQAANSVFIILLTPVVVWVMSFLRERGLEPSTPAKIGIGMLLTAAAYGIMVLASMAGGNTGRVSMWWLIGCYFVITIGELFVSPMGLSMVTKLAPRRMTAMLMGLWFLSTSLGNWFSGRTGKWFWKAWSHAEFFGLLVGTSLIAALVLVTQYRRLKAAMPPEGNASAEPPQDPTAPSSSSPIPVTAAGLSSPVT